MPYSLDDIKLFKSLDLEDFEIRGAKTGVNNSRSTSPLYDAGLYNPLKSILSGLVTTTSGDSTVRGISILDGSYNALNLVKGDSIIAGSITLTVTNHVDATAVTVRPTPTVSGTVTDATYSLGARHYLIEPDVGTNSVNGYATFTQGSTNVTGTGFLDTSAGDAIQLNTYQKYFIINNVVSDTSCVLTSPYLGSTASGTYTAKRWRLNRLTYQYTKNDFEYDTQTARWNYDSTTGGDQTAYSSFYPFLDGIDLKFTPTLKPSKYPDLMDSNLVLGKTLSRSTTYDMFQYPLPAVPNPEESFDLFINDVKKVNGKDYVINYSQMPTYQYPPPVDQRLVANVMFMNYIQDSTLSPLATEAGVLAFTDRSGNTLQGIMPGTETIRIDGTVQTGEDYVIDMNSGVGYASTIVTNEPVVHYVMYQKKGLYDLGLNITLDGTAQQLTIPGDNSDDVVFDTESGRLKPATQYNPDPTDEYIVNYYKEGEYVSDEVIQTSIYTYWVRVGNYPIKPQSVILAKNGEYLDENVDYRVSCLTGRIVFFSYLNPGDSITVSYSPLVKQVNGLTYENGENYTKAYRAETSVNSLNPLSFIFPNPELLSTGDLPVITNVYNVTRSDATYDLSGYKFSGANLELVNNPHNVSIGTQPPDEIAISYKFQQDGVEYTPVQTVNFIMPQGANFIALVDQDVPFDFPSGFIVRMTNVDTAGDFYFRILYSYFDGEDTIVVFDGQAPSDITNPAIFISDGDSDFFSIPGTAYPVMSGATEIQFPGNTAAREFRPGHLLNLGMDYYYVINSTYDSSSRNSIITFNVESSKNYSTSELSQVTRSDYPLYYEGDTVVSTQYDIIPEPPAPILSLNYDGYATVTKDSSALSVDIGSTHYTFLDASYSTSLEIFNALTGIGFNVNYYTTGWQTSKFTTFTNQVVTADSSTLITGTEALRLGGSDTTRFSTAGGILTLANPLVRGQRYNFDYLGQRFLGDSTVVFSGSYFNYLPAKSKVAVSMKYDNLDQFYIQVLSQRQFLDDVIIPEKTEEAAQQNGNVGQGGDIQGDDAGAKEQGGLVNNEFRRADASITCNVFNNIFDFFNLRLQSYADEAYALKGWNLCNNDGVLSEEDQDNGASSINRMFPWSDYVSMPPYPITCLTGQSVPYATAGPKKPSYARKTKKRPIRIRNAPCRAIFNGTDVTCTTSAAPSYWTKQLRVGDFIRPLDRTVNHTITAIINDSSMTISPPYWPPVYKPFVMTSKYPLYDDDGYTGPKIIGTSYEDFGLEDGDVFNIQVDGSDQSYVFQSQDNPVLEALFPLSGFTATDVARILSAALDIKVSVEWTYDSDSAYGYSTGLVARVDGTRNNLIMKHGAAVAKLGFPIDSTVFGNNDNTHANPEFVYLNAERADRVTQLGALSNSLSILNKLSRPIPDVYTVESMALDESSQINREMLVLNRELVAHQVILGEPSMPGYANTVTANTLTKQFMADSSVAMIYDQSIFTNYQGFGDPQRWQVNLQHRDSTVVHGKKFGFAWPSYSGSGVVNILGQTSFAVGIEDDYDRRILYDTAIGVGWDSTFYDTPSVYYQDTSTVVDGSWTGFSLFLYSVDQTVSFHFNSQNLFVLRPYSAVFTADVTSSAAVTLDWSNGLKSFDFLTYPTIGTLKSAISKIPGITVSGSSIYDTTSSSDLTSMASTLLSPSVGLFDNSSVLLMTITADGTYNFSYKIDASGLGINWDSSSAYLPYSVYGNPWGVYAMKNYINTNIPGLDASGASIYDSSNPRGLKIKGLTSIPPDATVYSGLRECFVDLWTIDDKNLLDRSSYDNVRISQLDSRLNYLDVRENQIKDAFTTEELFMSLDTSSEGNIYEWADNRFNRSAGCEARLKQIEKQIQVSQSGLQISKRFL